jgi:nucleoside-diphosphate-sugar epimerase
VGLLRLDLAEDDLSEAVADVEIIYHLAGQPGLSASTPFETYLRNNVTATYRLLEAVKLSAALREFVYISSSSVYGSDATGPESSETRPTSHYGVTKLAGEQLALAYSRDMGLPACSARIFSVYGPRERPEKLFPVLIRSILEDTPFPLYEGSDQHLRSFTYVGDIVDGLVSVLDHLGECVCEIFNLGSETATTTGEAIRIVEDIIGKRARIEEVPPRPGDQLRTHANIDRAKRVLGYDPPTTMREGLEKEVRWFQEHISGMVE